MTEPRTKVFLSGPLQVICDDGRDATPRGTKAKALLALVLLSRNGVRSRAWIQDRLWSDSAPAQGASSLRKELSVLTKHFATFGLTFFVVDRQNVSVEFHAIEVDIFEERVPSDHAELLEGLDVGDPEFEDWLTVERQAFWEVGSDDPDVDRLPFYSRLHRQLSGKRPAVVLEPMEVVGSGAELLVAASSIHDELMFLLGTLSDVIEVRDARRQEASVDGYILSGSVVGAEGLRLSVQLTDTSDQTCLWSARYRFRQQDTFDAVEEIAVKVVEALQLNLRDGHWIEIWSSYATTTEVWTAFQLGRKQEAQTNFSGLTHAIRQYNSCSNLDPTFVPAKVAVGFCRLDLIRLGMDATPDDSLSEVETSSRLLRETYPDDPYCIALEAFTKNVGGSTSEACSLMHTIFERFPHSPELLGYYAGLLGYDDQIDAEISVCRQALALTPHPPIWIEANLALALALANEKGAWRHAHNVLRVAPDNVRARMVLCVLSSEAGNISLATRHARRLRELQPDFCAERWAWPKCFRNPKHFETIAFHLKNAGL